MPQLHSSHQLRTGLKILINNEPYIIIDNDMVKPGKGQAFNRIKLRNLKTGRILDKTLKSGESLPEADVIEIELQYLYHDNENWHFMDPKNYEQYSLNKTVMGDAISWIKEEMLCNVIIWNNSPLSISLPNFVVLQVTYTDPGLKGDTVSGGTKPITLETGASLHAPLFVQSGDWVKVDTRSGEYVSRVQSG